MGWVKIAMAVAVPSTLTFLGWSIGRLDWMSWGAGFLAGLAAMFLLVVIEGAKGRGRII
jgi:hypothetical protein